VASSVPRRDGSRGAGCSFFVSTDGLSGTVIIISDGDRRGPDAAGAGEGGDANADAGTDADAGPPPPTSPASSGPSSNAAFFPPSCGSRSHLPSKSGGAENARGAILDAARHDLRDPTVGVNPADRFEHWLAEAWELLLLARP
jgi:hypothetical protein